MIASYE